MNDQEVLGIGICSFQRSAHLSRLLDSIEAAVTETRIPVDVVVCLDGSTDDSEKTANSRKDVVSFPLRVLWQENKGLSAARNRCAGEFADEIVWMLDDDMLITSEALRHHYEDDRTSSEFVVGPCAIETVDSSEHVQAIARFYETRHSRLVEQFRGKISDPRDFSAANTSAPASAWRDVGFDEGFQGYGFEDYDFAARAFSKGYRARFDQAAVVFHDMHLSSFGKLKQHRAEGVNRVMFVRAHPELGRSAFRNKPFPAEAKIREFAKDWASIPLWCGSLGAWAISVVVPKRFKAQCWEFALTFAGYSGVAKANGTDLAREFTIPPGEFSVAR